MLSSPPHLSHGTRPSNFTAHLPSCFVANLSVPTVYFGQPPILSARYQRKETSVGFLLSLIVAFSYFFLMLMVGWVKSKPDWHPEWLIWTPNVVFLAGGAALFHKLARR